MCNYDPNNFKTLELEYDGEDIRLCRIGDKLYIAVEDICAATGIEYDEERFEDISRLTFGSEDYVTEAGAVSICLELGKEAAGEFIGWFVCEAFSALSSTNFRLASCLARSSRINCLAASNLATGSSPVTITSIGFLVVE